MNAGALQGNKRLDQRDVQDLNTCPELGLEDGKYDAILVCFTIQYYKFPELILSQLVRAMKDDGIIIVSWDGSSFTSKAIRGWLDRDEQGRIGLVLRLLAASGFITPQQHAAANSETSAQEQDAQSSLYIVSAKRRGPLKSARDRWGFGRARTQDVEALES